MLLYIMKILRNLLGDHSKIHVDSIFFEIGSNDDGFYIQLGSGLQIALISKVYNRRAPYDFYYTSPTNFKKVYGIARNTDLGLSANMTVLHDAKINYEIEFQRIRMIINQTTLSGSGDLPFELCIIGTHK